MTRSPMTPSLSEQALPMSASANPASDVVVYYHGDCLDGFGAAYAAWRRHGNGARYLPVHYGQSWRAEDVAGREVFVLDFTFPRDELLAMARRARSLQLIDHHASARDMWRDLLQPAPDGAGLTYRDADTGLAVRFDLDRSGAHLAWAHFHAGEPLPRALAHVEDQDLWRFGLEHTRAFCRALRLRPFSFSVWDQIVRAAERPDDPLYLALCAEGESIERFLRVEVDRLSAGGLIRRVVLRGEPIDPLQAQRHGQTVVSDGERSWAAVPGLAVNANALFASELGHRLAGQSGSFGLVWQLAADGQVRASLRADGQVDVARIAERYGGGGHRNAAGFRMPLERFVAEILLAGR